MEELQPAEVVEGYEILEVTRAFPGWASYRAVQRESGRQVTIKACHTDAVAAPVTCERFLREAQVLAEIRHPNIVAFYDCISTPRGVFLVHEWVEGQTLAEVLETRGPIAPREAVELLLPILDALAGIHALGAVHRDLTPQAMVMASDGVVKLIDLGCLKIPTEGPVTTSPAAVGTLGYQSPEQVMARPIDGRADVFSFAVTLFELTTGQKPFGLQNPFQHVQRVQQGPKARPETIVPDYPKPLADTLIKAMDFYPERRPQTVGDLKQALRASV